MTTTAHTPGIRHVTTSGRNEDGTPYVLVILANSDESAAHAAMAALTLGGTVATDLTVTSVVFLAESTDAFSALI